ncbi:Zinc transporter ZIP11 [Galemys pyrenaicus]|uniref:Zinc transporter ZIP11 n=1 Tax=Galemys pyrenaicus TaxID=202257 RepID=A0A8J5ZQ64_GALPY|nr:Zinc transporter ZIP11 [Galemys pyrenaicus]
MAAAGCGRRQRPLGVVRVSSKLQLFFWVYKNENGEAYQRKKTAALPEGPTAPVASPGALAPSGGSWRRIVLLILAITIHNVPDLMPEKFGKASHSSRLATLAASVGSSTLACAASTRCLGSVHPG